MKVPGLFLIPDFLSTDEEEWLIEEIDAGKWQATRNGDRRVQVYGPYHDRNYKIIPGKYSNHPEYIGDLVELMFQRLDDIPLSDKLRDQQLTEVYINEYKEGQTLRQHFDQRSTYDECIIGVSCGSDAVMCFSSGKDRREILVPRRSLYAMTGQARFKYQHGIQQPIPDRRVSLTFRTV